MTLVSVFYSSKFTALLDHVLLSLHHCPLFKLSHWFWWE